jgi:hypothetical protein
MPVKELQSASPLTVPFVLKEMVYCAGVGTVVTWPVDWSVRESHCQLMPWIGFVI